MSSELIAALAGAAIAFLGGILILFLSLSQQAKGKTRESRRLVRSIVQIIISNIDEYERFFSRTSVLNDVSLKIIGDQCQIFWRTADTLAFNLEGPLFAEIYSAMAETSHDQMKWFASYEASKTAGLEEAQILSQRIHAAGNSIVARRESFRRLEAKL